MSSGSVVGRSAVLYVAVLILFGAGIYAILHAGSGLRPASDAPIAARDSAGVAEVLHENLRHPLSVLLLQVIVILLASRVMGAVFRRVGQPAVMGEMAAGILLGPSLLGAISPAAESFLFPAVSLEPLHLLSQVGVILFMFIVGIELETQHLRDRADAAILVSHASIIVPFFLGTAFSLAIYRSVAPAGVSFTAFALFMGIAMSITAFPVLARILDERGMTRTSLGATAIACAAIDDVTAWCLLALVVATVKADGLFAAALTVALAAVFTALMLFAARPRMARVIQRLSGAEPHSKGLMAGILALVLASALATEVIGIHALFGAFLAGVIMPVDEKLRAFLKSRLEIFSSVFLLPLFFAFTGLRTQVGLLGDWRDWLLCAGVIGVAVCGKLGASALAARWTGMGWVDSLCLGVLMNTRGLMELIALNIGYDLGILSPRMFTMMVIMALVTTMAAGPGIVIIERWRRRQPA